ncbi:MAG TPA: hypothetical protein VG326_01295 [Tepidisphaeraceae bacterium]|nr:hypothetical protein [Tepidisphaeraceae bacterium]
MEQVFEGTPKTTLTVDGTIVTRQDVTDDWGSRLQWKVTVNGNAVTTATALRTERSYTHPATTPGKYEIVLQMFKYVNYKKTGAGGEYTDSKYVDISNVVTYTL